jgi:PBP1b-binding outer membrane lipoprotein LpoB
MTARIILAAFLLGGCSNGITPLDPETEPVPVLVWRGEF